ncbi:hypothetical protein [Nocardioides sp. KR10-350]|uniref:hypothetical protein n=1 Tax=Nocardioides cheoyonin TaxID=3156615 RepID=UPI0032B54264
MTADAFDRANEADVEEQEQPVVDDAEVDEEEAAGNDVPPRRDDVDEADYLDQVEAVSGFDDDYPYGESEEDEA